MPMPMIRHEPVMVVRTVAELRAKVAAWRAEGLRVGLVPTMGALHAGHLSLVRRALTEADRAIATIFVNPTQFAPNEDFDRYPRRETEDTAQLEGAGAHLLYAPQPAEIYPPGFATSVTVTGLTDCLCGPFRPGHFTGVATVVAKLLLQALPDVAVFGEKDYQQLQVIKRLTVDLDIPVRILGAATVREADGLALSSRNAYLQPEERRAAAAIYRTLSAIAARLAAGEPAAAPLDWGRRQLLAAGFRNIDYLDFRDAATLAALPQAGPAGRVLVAAWIGGTRLIDNVPVPAATA